MGKTSARTRTASVTLDAGALIALDTFTGAQMASFHLVSGVVCVAVVSRYLGEAFELRQIGGFALLAVAVLLLLKPT